ncbi:MAG: TolC family protein [Alphaproteobacteria bacterium]|nr:TolC family protein [Alphaproteobacteria bacterium]
MFKHCCGAALLTAAMAAIPPVSAQPVAPGANVEELLALLIDGSPALAATVAERRAAAARADAADSLPDPTFRFLADEVDREGNAEFRYSLEQDFPLWGKRGLRKGAAAAEAAAARAREDGTASTLAAEAKIAFAQSYLAHGARRLVSAQRHEAASQAVLAATRYARGLGSAADGLRAEAERARLESELHRLDAETRALRARLNGLLGRAADAPLAEPARLVAMPPPERLASLELRSRLLRDSPTLRAAAAEQVAAEQERRLAERDWYPDVSVMLGGIDRRDNGPPALMAGIGVRLPIQLGLRRASERAATERLAAAARLTNLARNAEAELDEALAALAAARAVEATVRDSLLPQAEAAYRLALLAFERGRAADIDAVLDTSRRLLEARLEALKAEVEQRRQLARIERLVGGDLWVA